MKHVQRTLSEKKFFVHQQLGSGNMVIINESAREQKEVKRKTLKLLAQLKYETKQRRQLARRCHHRVEQD